VPNPCKKVTEFRKYQCNKKCSDATNMHKSKQKPILAAKSMEKGQNPYATYCILAN
jgi:hypothetical protein